MDKLQSSAGHSHALTQLDSVCLFPPCTYLQAHARAHALSHTHAHIHMHTHHLKTFLLEDSTHNMHSASPRAPPHTHTHQHTAPQVMALVPPAPPSPHPLHPPSHPTHPTPPAPRLQREERRILGLVLLRGEEVISLTIEGPPPQEDLRAAKSQVAPPGTGAGRAAGRGMPVAAPGQAPAVGGFPHAGDGGGAGRRMLG